MSKVTQTSGSGAWRPFLNPGFTATCVSWGPLTQKHLHLLPQREGLLGEVPNPLAQLRGYSLWFPTPSGFTSRGTEMAGSGNYPS